MTLLDRPPVDPGSPSGQAPAASRKGALDALERLLRAQAALREHRDLESPYGLLRPASEEESTLIDAVFRRRGVPLPPTLRAIHRRTLGVGNPVDALPVLAVPVLRAALPRDDRGRGPVGLEAFGEALGLAPGEPGPEEPPTLCLGRAGPLGLTVARSGLWSLRPYGRGGRDPRPSDFDRPFEAAFRALVDQALLIWANDLAGDPVRPGDLDVARGAGLAAMPPAVREAWAHLVAPRALGPRAWEDVALLDHPDLAGSGADGAEPPGSPVTVVGLPYAPRPEVARDLPLGCRLRLRPVADNPHDPDAVEVWHDGPVPARVGFVARAQAPRVRALPQGAAAWRLRVIGRTDAVLCAALERAAAAGDGARAGAEPDLFEAA